MKRLFIYSIDLVVCLVFLYVLLHFLVSSKYDFHVVAERMIVITREM